ncbi:hypothetical protein JM93_00471 [Roseibium hamelinense]|uniref:Uncharacterized protein n=1 Tax=Roseibium hamelinense TaxID=150831 RepID=A0A562TH01_9HYPH|nr:hypothetical protein [Roseibium hamelinense]MTI45896.1 hypothetical protein [Roseibium hamelinense]TWI92919.1 hypothetical protein JM93_00471 [Roseibium hamelinense]
MISAIVDGVLLLALIVTTIKIVTMYRELKRLGAYHTEYQRIFDQTALALDGIEVSIQEINVRSSQLLNALGTRMDDARELIAEIDSITREAKRQQSVLKAELKELSRATAEFQAPQTFRKSKGSEDTLAAKVLGGRKSRANSAAGAQTQASVQLDTPVSKKPTRIHRIDDAFGSPFRSVSMNQKDEL